MSIASYKALTKAPNEDAPLIFAFHGTGGDENQFFDLAQELVPEAGVVRPAGTSLKWERRVSSVAPEKASMIWKTLPGNSQDVGFRGGVESRAPGPAGIWVWIFKRRKYSGFRDDGARPDSFDRVGLLHPLIPWDPAPAPTLKGHMALPPPGDEIQFARGR